MASPLANAWKRRPAAARSSTAPPARRLTSRRRPAKLRGVYDGTESSRQSADWTAQSGNPTELTGAHLELLRGRSRSLARTSPQVTSAFQAIVDNVVGSEGFRARPRPFRDELGQDADEELADRVAMLWEGHIEAIDVDRRESLPAMMRTALREYPEAGEIFVVETTLPPGDARTGLVPQAIQLIPGERVDHTLHSAIVPVPRLRRGHRVINGIEFDRLGRRVGYYVTRLDEYGLPAIEAERLPAVRVNHLFHRLRAGQERGVPWLYASTMLAHDLDDLVDSELTSAQVAACLSAFIRTEGGTIFEGANAERDADDNRPVVRFEPGMVGYLGPGEEIDTIDPNRPSGAFEPFANFLTRTLAKALGPSYETISGDYRRVNFASGRLAHLAERKAYRRIMADTIGLVIRPIYRSFVRRLVLAELVQVSPADYIANPRRFDRVDIRGPGWEHHDPAKEASAAILRILGGISTVSEEAAALNRDWRAVFEQRGKELDVMAELGLPLFTAGGAQLVQQQQAGGPPPTSPLGKRLAALEDLVAGLVREDPDVAAHIGNGRLNGHAKEPAHAAD